MSQFAREFPEDYAERIEAMRERADQERKEAKENPERHYRKVLADAKLDKALGEGRN